MASSYLLFPMKLLLMGSFLQILNALSCIFSAVSLHHCLRIISSVTPPQEGTAALKKITQRGCGSQTLELSHLI